MPPAPAIVLESPYPHPQSDDLLKQSFGGDRLARDVYRLRAGRPPVAELCHGLLRGDALIALIRYWEVALLLGESDKMPGRFLLLGPLAVAPSHSRQGHGWQLIRHSLDLARRMSYQAVFVSGDADYYQKLGFTPVKLDAPMNTAPNIWQMLPLKTVMTFPADRYRLAPLQ